MKKIEKYLSFVLLVIGVFIGHVHASSNQVYVNLSTMEISSDGKSYEAIKEYDTLDAFLEAKENNNLPVIYITNFLYDGVAEVKSPDLDDFIDNDSNTTKIKTLEIRVINVNTTGDIEFTGTTTGSMIGVNTNNVTNDINLILNNVSIDTDSKKAPAIFIYNKDTTYTGCKVTIKTTKDSKNYIEGGKLKKVSLLPSESLDSYTSNYSGTSLENYQKYSNYYGIYTKEEINNILFATVTADSEDLQDGDPLYFYKGSGAISSDIDLYFEGEGYLKVTSKNKEGIETKGNLTFNGGTGDYEIYAYDDCLNTTTASSSGNNVHNDMSIDVNSLLAVVNDEGDEGDAIDSNGTLIINGGTIYAFSHSTSQDAGLDSEKGTIINGGTIIATGNMTDAISSESKQYYIYAQFNEKISAGTLLVIKNQNSKIITAFKTDKDIQTILYSSAPLSDSSYEIYSGGTIDGEETNGLYTTINSYTDGTKISYTEVSSQDFPGETKSNVKSSTVLLIALVSEIILFLVVSIIYFAGDKPRKMVS